MKSDALFIRGHTMTQKQSIRTTVSIPEEDYEFIAKQADEKKVSLSWVVREAVAEYRSKQMTLFPEEEELASEKLRVFNVASVPHRSPFRYPGGKTWLVPYVRSWLGLRATPLDEFVEPFAGGGIVALSVLFDGLAKKITLAELDPDVSSVWKTIVDGKSEQLASMIMDFEITRENVIEVLSKNHRRVIDKAFATIVRNRTQRGGILAPGASLMNNGENGRGVKSRWYPQTLAKRLREIDTVRKNISFIEGDGIEVLEEKSNKGNIAFFIDPPYTVAGRRLYRHNEVNHEMLFSVVSQLSGDFLVTYDNAPEIKNLAEEWGFPWRTIPMKNTHHAIQRELVVGKNLTWVDLLLRN